MGLKAFPPYSPPVGIDDGSKLEEYQAQAKERLAELAPVPELRTPEALAGYREQAATRCDVCGDWGCEQVLCDLQRRLEENERRLRVLQHRHDELEYRHRYFRRNAEIEAEIEKMNREVAAIASREVHEQAGKLSKRQRDALAFPSFALVMIVIALAQYFLRC